MAVDAHGGVLNHQVVHHHRADRGAAHQHLVNRHVRREGVQVDGQGVAGATQAGTLVHVHINGGSKSQNARVRSGAIEPRAHVVSASHLQAADAQGQEVEINVQLGDTHLGIQVEGVGGSINADANLGEGANHVEVAGQQGRIGMTLQRPVTGADTEIDRRRGDREDVDQCVTVIRDVDIDLDVVDQITGLTEQGVAEIGDLLEQICTVGATNLDVFDGQ